MSIQPALVPLLAETGPALAVRPARVVDLSGARDLYETSFPADGLAPWPEQVRRFVLGPDRLGVAVETTTDGAERVVGLAITASLGASTVLRYLAVDPAARGTGIGRVLLGAAAGQARGDASDWLLVEIEDPHGPVHPIHGDPLRRLAFYERLGAEVLTCDYAIPDLAPDLARPAVVPMWLLGMPLTSARTMSVASLRLRIALLWGPDGHKVDPADRRLAAVLDRLGPLAA